MNQKNLLAIMVAGLSLIACSSNQAPISAPVASQPIVSNDTHNNDMSNNKVNNSVYFAFDKYDINNQYQDLVVKNANYLMTNKSSSVKVEGNTDDIGSVEYNLALGQKRSDAVKKALVSLGATPSQVEATSNGKLRPKFSNNSENDRSQNRRSDIMYEKSPINGYSLDQSGLPTIQ